MSKKRLLLASAILSVATLAASCGGGGGGGTANATTTTPPPSTTTTPPSPTVGSLGTPAVFTRLSPAGAGQDRYYFVDGSGNKVEVTDLAGQDITTVLYQFNNANLLVRTTTNKVFCVDVSNASAKDLGLTFAGHAYANVTNELVRNRPYFLMNATDGGYVITKDCNVTKVSLTQFAQIMAAADANGQNVFAINNTYAIVQDNATNPNVFVVRADGSFERVISDGQNPAVRIDNSVTRPAGSYTTFLVGDNAKNYTIYLVDATGSLVPLVTSPLSNFGNRTRINQSGNAYNVVMDDATGTVLSVWRVAGGSANYYEVNTTTLNCAAGAGIAIDAFDLDASGNLFVGVRHTAAGACLSGQTGGVANDRFIAVFGNNGALIGGGEMKTPASQITRIVGMQNGAFVVNAANEAAYFFLAPNLTVRDLAGTGNHLVYGGAPVGANQFNCSGLAGTNSANIPTDINTAAVAAPANVRFKNSRTGTLLIGLINTTNRDGNAGNDNLAISLTLSPAAGADSCVYQGENNNAGDAFSANLDRNITNAFVINRGGVLRHYTTTGAPVAKNAVTEVDFAGNACGGLGQLVQIYSATDRACVTPVPGGFTYNYVNYNTDAVTPNTITGAGAGINAPTFGDVANNNNALFAYLDSAANRGNVSFCPSGNTWEYLILGNNNVQYPASGSQTVGLCFKVFNSFNGAGGVGNNNALGVPFIKF
ncbi:MAG: hypothetical protein QXO67_03210 [Candidatus Bathyarchaeia archaeon]